MTKPERQKKMANKTDIKIETLSISDVIADHDWNARSGWELSTEGEHGHSYKELVEGIAAEGQKNAVDVMVDPKKKGKYKLLAGFRRYSALVQLDKKTIIARVHPPLDAAQQRLINIKENTEREDLRGSDVAWAVMQYLTEVGADKRPTQEQMAQIFSLSQSYVSKICQIADKVRPDVVEAWRAGRPVGAKEDSPRIEKGILKFLEVAKVDKDRQVEAYNALFGLSADGQTKAKPVEKDAYTVAKKAAEKLGEVLGRLLAEEVITVTADMTKKIELFVPEVKPLDKKQQVAIAAFLEASCLKAKQAALNPPEESEEEDKEAAQ